MSRESKPFRERALGVLSAAFGGLHHVDTERVRWFNEDSEPLFERCEYSTISDLSTFDGSTLTILVVAAHDLCVRLSVKPGGPRGIKLVMWPREREGDFAHRHPTMEANMGSARAYGERWYDVDPIYLRREGRGGADGR